MTKPPLTWCESASAVCWTLPCSCIDAATDPALLAMCVVSMTSPRTLSLTASMSARDVWGRLVWMPGRVMNMAFVIVVVVRVEVEVKEAVAATIMIWHAKQLRDDNKLR